MFQEMPGSLQKMLQFQHLIFLETSLITFEIVFDSLLNYHGINLNQQGMLCQDI